MSGGLNAVNLVANLAIVVGYVLVPATWLSYLPLNTAVRIAGVGFFTTCAITHLSMAFGFSHSPGMVANHVIQAVFVLWFVLAFWSLLRRAHRERMARATAAGQPPPLAESPDLLTADDDPAGAVKPPAAGREGI